jgi:carboxyl-terminal processing protease
MDLRNNGGGSLGEANSLVGLFVKKGPTVQVKDADGDITVMGNPDSDTSWDGPLAVLVNRLSASASEIFAGAIQDYQRGLILGSQTFGKGTVQELIPMGDGQIKITRSKFYRISGASTQHKGVTPNIQFPDLYEASDDIGESALPTALPWDTIEPNFYKPYTDLRLVVPTLISRHDARMQNDPDFVFIRAEVAEAKRQQAHNLMQLSETKLQQERNQRDQWRLEQTNKLRKAKGKEPYKDVKAMDTDNGAIDEDDATGNKAPPGTPSATGKKDSKDKDKDKKDPDPYLVESGKILLDMAELQSGKKITVASKAAGI